MSADSSYTDIFVNTQRKTAPQALFATIEAAKRGQVGKTELEKAAKDFESVFLGQMLHAMVPEDGEENPLFGNQESDKVFQTMMVDEYAKQMSKSGGIGIASYIQRELLGQQEVSKDAHSQKNKLGILKMGEDANTPEPEAEVAPSVIAAAESNEIPATAKPSSPVVTDADAVVNDIFNGGS